jgi:hypothetical protein
LNLCLRPFSILRYILDFYLIKLFLSSIGVVDPLKCAVEGTDDTFLHRKPNQTFLYLYMFLQFLKLMLSIFFRTIFLYGTGSPKKFVLGCLLYMSKMPLFFLCLHLQLKVKVESNLQNCWPSQHQLHWLRVQEERREGAGFVSPPLSRLPQLCLQCQIHR